MLMFFFNSFLLGAALAMDACAVSMADGLNEPNMKVYKVTLIAFMFGFFQALMPLIGYFIGHAVLTHIETFIPYIALVLLLFLGCKMIVEGVKNKDEKEEIAKLTFLTLIFQSIATSIDALSVGFTFADYTINEALLCALIIAIVTFIICFAAVYIGKKFGDKLGNKAIIFGGILLIGIGLEIFITSFF